MSTKVYDFNIPANGVFNLPVVGTYYKILTCSGALEVQRGGGSRLGPILAGQGEREAPYTQLTIADKSGSQNIGSILISDVNFVDDRVTGEVAFVDGGSVRTRAGKSFSGILYCAPVAGQYSNVQLWNTGSTNFYLTQIVPQTPVAQFGVLSYNSAQLASNTYLVYNKYLGLANSTNIQSRFESTASPLVPTGQIGWLRIPAASFIPFKFTEPYLIPPGKGFNLSLQGVNVELDAMFEGFEE